MHLKKVSLVCCSILTLMAVLLSSCFKDLTHTTIIYQNDFESGNRNKINVSGWQNNNTSFGTITDTKIWHYNNSNVLGRFNNCIVNFSVSGLPSHQTLRVEFDLYLHDQWNNELWKMNFDGSPQLLTGFSNDAGILQSYPNWLGNGSALNPAGADAQNINLPGICKLVASERGTSLYRIVRTVLHSSSTFQLDISDAGGAANDTCTRSWSMDNIKISVFSN